MMEGVLAAVVTEAAALQQWPEQKLRREKRREEKVKMVY